METKLTFDEEYFNSIKVRLKQYLDGCLQYLKQISIP